MLLPSHRHKTEDLKLWACLERADIAHSLSVGRWVESAAAELSRFVEAGPAYIAFSGGKDSACVVALAAAGELLGSLPCVWFRAMPKFNPDVPCTTGAMQERFPAMRLTVIDYESPVPIDVPRHVAERIARANFDRACAEAERRFGRRRVLGIRADESAVRRLSIRGSGRSTTNSCRPLGHWSNRDVFAFAAMERVPLCPVYGMLGGGRFPREQIRVDALMGDNGSGLGRAEWELEYYGEVLRRLQAGQRAPPPARRPVKSITGYRPTSSP